MTKRDEAALRVVEKHRKRVDYLEDFTIRTLAASWIVLKRDIIRELKQMKEPDPVNLPPVVRYQMQIEPAIRSRAERYAAETERVMLSLAETTADLGASSADQSARRIAPKNWQRIRTAGLFTGPLLNASKEAIKRLPGAITEKLSDLITQAVGMAENGLDWIMSQLGDLMGNLWSGIQRTVRTLAEQMFRRAQQEQAKQTPPSVKWRRIANHETACLACLMLEGTIYDKKEDFADHPNGRCTIVPVENASPDEHPGRDWFLEQDEETQKRIMGKGRWEAWQRGDISLDEMVDVKVDPIYGPIPHIKPLKAFGLTP